MLEHEHNFMIPLQLEDTVENLSFDVYIPKKDEIETHTLSDYRDKRLILFFYPADFTFVCPTELKDLNKVREEIREQNAEVLVASVDSVFAHKRRVETEGLLKGFDINMISDRKGELSSHLWILNQKSWNSERASFIISPAWIIKSIEVVTEPIGRSSHELVRKLKALEYVAKNPWQACPASRNTGSKTLTPSVKIAGNVDKELE